MGNEQKSAKTFDLGCHKALRLRSRAIAASYSLIVKKNLAQPLYSLFLEDWRDPESLCRSDGSLRPSATQGD